MDVAVAVKALRRRAAAASRSPKSPKLSSTRMVQVIPNVEMQKRESHSNSLVADDRVSNRQQIVKCPNDKKAAIIAGAVIGSGMLVSRLMVWRVNNSISAWSVINRRPHILVYETAPSEQRSDGDKKLDNPFHCSRKEKRIQTP